MGKRKESKVVDLIRLPAMSAKEFIKPTFPLVVYLLTGHKKFIIPIPLQSRIFCFPFMQIFILISKSFWN